MTHATIELLNAEPHDLVQFQRTASGLLVHYHRGGRRVSAAIKRDALDQPYAGHDPLGKVLADLRERLTVDESRLART